MDASQVIAALSAIVLVLLGWWNKMLHSKLKSVDTRVDELQQSLEYHQRGCVRTNEQNSEHLATMRKDIAVLTTDLNHIVKEQDKQSKILDTQTNKLDDIKTLVSSITKGR